MSCLVTARRNLLKLVNRDSDTYLGVQYHGHSIAIKPLEALLIVIWSTQNPQQHAKMASHVGNHYFGHRMHLIQGFLVANPYVCTKYIGCGLNQMWHIEQNACPKCSGNLHRPTILPIQSRSLVGQRRTSQHKTIHIAHPMHFRNTCWNHLLHIWVPSTSLYHRSKMVQGIV